MESGRYLLKHKDFDVAVLQFNSVGNISKIDEILLKERLPLGCVIEGVVSDKRIIQWWNERGIPVGRENYNFLLNELKNGGKNNWLKDSIVLNLYNHYWITNVVTNNTQKWYNVNYYSNS
jgi:hypothetical protein